MTSTPGGTVKSNKEARRPVLGRIDEKKNSDFDPSECTSRRRRMKKVAGSTSIVTSVRSVLAFGYILTTFVPSKNGVVFSNSNRVNSLRRLDCPNKNISGIRSSNEFLTASLLT